MNEINTTQELSPTPQPSFEEQKAALLGMAKAMQNSKFLLTPKEYYSLPAFIRNTGLKGKIVYAPCLTDYGTPYIRKEESKIIYEYILDAEPQTVREAITATLPELYKDLEPLLNARWGEGRWFTTQYAEHPVQKALVKEKWIHKKTLRGWETFNAFGTYVIKAKSKKQEADDLQAEVEALRMELALAKSQLACIITVSNSNTQISNIPLNSKEARDNCVIQVAFLQKQGYTYPEIARELRVSRATVGRLLKLTKEV